MKYKILIVLAILSLVVLTGCNTFEVTCYDKDDINQSQVVTMTIQTSPDSIYGIAHKRCAYYLSDNVININQIN